MPKLEDVFGVGRGVPLSYVERSSVDPAFQRALQRGKHIVLYGGSKQGKTCLRKHCMEPGEYVVIQCGSTMDLRALQASILKAAGYRRIQTEQHRNASRRTFGGEAGVKALGIGAQIEGRRESEESRELSFEYPDIDLANPNDIIAALDGVGFSKRVVLEDFHYLSRHTQKQFADTLKGYFEGSDICFIVVGVWREQNRLVALNGDLLGRIEEVDVDRWRQSELVQIAETGAELLNTDIDQDFAFNLAYHCHGFVYILQEVCYNVFFEQGGEDERSTARRIGRELHADREILEVLAQQDGRYLSLISEIARGFQRTSLEIYKWLTYSILTCNVRQLETGIPASELQDRVIEIHPLGGQLNVGNITQALKSLVRLQNSKGIRPLVFDYDPTAKVLHIVDRGLLLWIQSLASLGHMEIPLPVPEMDWEEDDWRQKEDDLDDPLVHPASEAS